MAEWETALDLLAQLRAGQVDETGNPLDADTFSFNATINALGRGGEWKKAVALLREMTQAGLGVKVRSIMAIFVWSCYSVRPMPRASNASFLDVCHRFSSPARTDCEHLCVLKNIGYMLQLSASAVNDSGRTPGGGSVHYSESLWPLPGFGFVVFACFWNTTNVKFPSGAWLTSTAK